MPNHTASQPCDSADGRPVAPGAFRAGLCVALTAFLCLLWVVPLARADDILRAQDYKMAGDASRMRVVMHFDREPELRWSLLKRPHRLVFDLPEAGFAFEDEELEPRGMVTGVRYGNLDSGSSRMKWQV